VSCARRRLGAPGTDDAWERWRRSAQRAVRARLGADLTVVVAGDPSAPGRLVACGAGTITERLPNPWHVDARVGYIQWMSTEPAFRRQGLGRAVLRGLLEWFTGRGVDTVELHASDDGARLYLAEGFWRGTGGEAMRRRPWDPPPGP